MGGPTGLCVRLIGAGGLDLTAVYSFEDELGDALAAVGGEVDGHGVGEDAVEVFVYGVDVVALRQVTEAALRSTAFERWEIEPVGFDDDNDADGGDGKDAPRVEVWPVTSPPHWWDDRWIEVRSSQDGTVDGPRLFGTFDEIRPRPDCEVQPAPASVSPIFEVAEPLGRVDGTSDPWVVHGPRDVYETLFLPSWLLAAPSTGQVSFAAARSEMWVDRDRATAERRRDRQNVLGDARTLLDELRVVDAAGVVWWWDDDQWSGSQRFESGRQLVELLTAEASSSRPRGHLIEGLRDADGLPVYWDL